jgi:hypothetical protein
VFPPGTLFSKLETKFKCTPCMGFTEYFNYSGVHSYKPKSPKNSKNLTDREIYIIPSKGIKHELTTFMAYMSKHIKNSRTFIKLIKHTRKTSYGRKNAFILIYEH